MGLHPPKSFRKNKVSFVGINPLDNLTMGAVFTLVSIVRSYLLRRLFEAIRLRQVSNFTRTGVW